MISRRYPLLCLVPFCLLAMIIAGCETITETTEPETKQVSEDEQTQNEIEILIELMSAPETPKIGDICRRLIEFGIKAVPELARNLDNLHANVRAWCLYCLSEIYRNTQSPALVALRPKAAKRLQDPAWEVQLEAASFLCIQGDYQGVPHLIRALRHEKAYVRMTAAQVLQNTFQMNFGYYHQDQPETREKAVASWEQWWQQKQQQ